MRYSRVAVACLTALCAFSLGCGTFRPLFTEHTVEWPKATPESRAVAVCLDHSSSVLGPAAFPVERRGQQGRPVTTQESEISEIRKWLIAAADPIGDRTGQPRKGASELVTRSAIERAITEKADPNPDLEIPGTPAFQVTVRRIALDDVTQTVLSRPEPIPQTGGKGLRASERYNEKPDTKGHEKRAHAWAEDLDQARLAHSQFAKTLEAEIQPAPNLYDDSNYLSCLAAAVDDLAAAQTKDRTLIVAGDFIADRFASRFTNRPFAGTRVILYSDCPVSTALDKGGPAEQYNRDRRSYCTQLESIWQGCFVAWGADRSNVFVVRPGQANPLITPPAQATSTAAGDCPSSESKNPALLPTPGRR